MDSRALFHRVASWAGATLSGRLSRQIRRAAVRQHRRLQKQADRLAPESLEQRALLAAVVAGYEVVNDWGSGFQGAMTLANQDTEAFGDWTVSFDYGADISSMWDARVVSREGSRYTVANAGYNAAFDPGRTIAFGFIGTPTAAGGAADAPTNFTINGEPLDGQPAVPAPAEPAPAPAPGPAPTPSPGPTPVPADPSVAFAVTSDWGSGFNGDITVTNRLLTLEARSGNAASTGGWTVSFDFDGEISSLWNGTIVGRSGSTYTVANATWNGSLAVGQSATFGFTGSPGGAAARLRNLTVAFDGVEAPAPTPTPEPAPAPAPEPNPEPSPVPPAEPTPPADSIGRVFSVNPAGPDIVAFDPAVDRLDFGDVSVHNLILGKLPSGEVAIVNPWAWTPEYQVLQEITFNDLTIENFGIVQNEHLRQDIGGAISWEQGIGPREAGTVYVRSHEYGVTQVIDGFNPAVNKLSFLYFGTRERLSVTDTAEGLLISVAPSGQSVLLSGVALSDLVPANIEFHHDQIVEDQLEVPFGFTVDQVTMVSRMALLTPQAPAGQMTDGHQTSPGSVQPHDPGHVHDPGHDPGGMDPMDPANPMPSDPMPSDPMPSHPDDGHDAMPPADNGFIDMATFGMSEGSDHTHLHDLEGGRTPITTEALVAYNGLRGFLGLAPVNLETVGQWAYDNQLTNNSQAWGNDLLGVGLYYSMQGAKVGWIRDAAFDPQILADIQRTARLGAAADALAMVEAFGHEGFREFLAAEGLEQHFVNTLKMEPHYAGWMHDSCNGWLDIGGVAIANDLNHLTVLSHDQTQPFMNDTFDWPQWPALEVSHDRVIEYFQSMVVLGNPLGENLMPPSGADPVPVDPTPADPLPAAPSDDAPVVTPPPATDPSAPGAELPIATHDKVLAAYFPEWGIYGRNYQLDDVPGEKLTHLIYSFADLTAAGEMTLFDSYAAVEKRFAAHESVSGEADQWYYPPGDPRADQTIWGNFNQLAQLKDKFPHLRVSIAVGGWTLSDHFSTVVATAAGRQTFADSIVTFLTTYEVFDGIDFDWEYPGGGGEAGNSVSPNDGANYALLMSDVRTKLDALGDARDRTYEISIASPAGLDKIANFNLPGLTPSVDFFNVMTYDFHGTWESTTGHQAAFTGDPNGYDIETAVKAYLDAGVAPSQIVLGAPLYTRAWSGVADGGDGGYAEGSSGAAPGTFEAGNYDYKDLLAQVQAPNSGWQLYWDDSAQASYVYNASEDIFSSFETPTSIALKAQWAEDLGLGGMMFWDLSNDATNSPESLIDAAYRSWVIDDSLESIRSSSSLTNEIIVGGDGIITPLEADWE